MNPRSNYQVQLPHEYVSLTHIPKPWKVAVSTTRLWYCSRAFSLFPHNSQNISQSRQYIRTILKHTQIKPGLLDSVLFCYFGHGTHILRNIYREFRIQRRRHIQTHQDSQALCMLRFKLSNEMGKKRRDIVYLLTDTAEQCMHNRLFSYFFINTLIMFLARAQ